MLAAAEQEGSVTLYSFQAQENLDALEAAFEEAYPAISLDVFRVQTGDGPAKLEAERDSGSAGADVYMDATMTWASQQLTQDPSAITTAVGPTVTAHAELHRDACACTITGFTAVGLGWNSDLESEPPRSLQDFLDPRFDGMIALPEIDSGRASFYAQLREYGGSDYWEQLAALDPKFYAGGTPVAQAVIAGEASVTPFAGPVQFGTARESGAPVEFAIPDGAPTWGPPFLAMILGWAEHPNAAQVLVDFLLSEPGQSAFNAMGLTALDTPVPGTIGTIHDAAPYDGDPTQEELDALVAEWHEVFGR